MLCLGMIVAVSPKHCTLWSVRFGRSSWLPYRYSPLDTVDSPGAIDFPSPPPPVYSRPSEPFSSVVVIALSVAVHSHPFSLAVLPTHDSLMFEADPSVSRDRNSRGLSGVSRTLVDSRTLVQSRETPIVRPET